jgi:hypothetical protein
MAKKIKLKFSAEYNREKTSNCGVRQENYFKKYQPIAANIR